eukprot:TRINITY_DN787_c1_g1_i1.p1 TRINITY_DN787_c1_g1~~TRINITY_DN787_c1_g1_i1.p1  ORF type:complete len:473 (+),score=215.14 TRINITY_DN787_c1_g1_i1:45-1421(+)
MRLLVAAAVLLGSALAHDADLSNPDGPFGDGKSREPVSIDYDTYARHIKGANREGYYVVMLVSQHESTGRSCQMCPYYNKQFDDFVGSYKDQYRGGDIYFEDGLPVYFVKVLEGSGSNKEVIRRDLHLRHMPAVVVLPPYKEGAANKPIEFARAPIDDGEHKRLKKDAMRVVDELKKLGKSKGDVAQLSKRRDRRRRQVITQEEMEYESYGVRNYHDFNTNNICKFLRVNAGMHVHVCPQDVPLDFEQKKKPQDLLKNVLVLVVLGSAGMWLCRIFGYILQPFDANKVELVALVHKKHCIENDDEHNMADIRPDWELYGTYILYTGWVMVYGLLAGGVYWNILHNVPWTGGKSGVAPGSRQQYGSETAMLGILYSTAAFSMVLAGAAMSQNVLDFTKAKGIPFSLDDTMRANIKFIMAVGGVSMWVVAFFLILRMFLMKNGSYLYNTSLGRLMDFLRP